MTAQPYAVKPFLATARAAWRPSARHALGVALVWPLLVGALWVASASTARAEEPAKPRIIAPGELRTRAEREKEALKAASLAPAPSASGKESSSKEPGKAAGKEPAKPPPAPDAKPGRVQADVIRDAIAEMNGKPAGKAGGRAMLVDGSAHGSHEAAARAAVVHRPARPVVITETHADQGRDVAPRSTSHPATQAAALAAVVGGAAAHASAEAHGSAHAVHWSYDGAGGPGNWAKLKPEFNLCALGKRQSPIHIEDNNTLHGPAEPLVLNYKPSNGTVTNNGHTVQVDVERGNTLTVRGSTYELLQFHFHYPSEERVNGKSYAMVAHLVHRNADGQLAVLGVLIDPGASSSLLQKVWTYMPLESGDKVRMPANWVDLNELLPKDQRYYQFMGSLTTPPCSENVLWMVLKQPVTASDAEIRLFSQLFPNNARPVQPLNGRIVRSAQ